MEAVNFVHLHLHSEYSLSDGIIRIEDLVNRTSEMGYPAVALTDLSNLFGLIKFYRLAREKGIKPIIGSEINLIKDIDSTPASLVLLVKNKTGFRSLSFDQHHIKNHLTKIKEDDKEQYFKKA